jgi:hypothetical protein
MKIINIESPFFIIDAYNHQINKNLILQSIQNYGIYSYKNQLQSIYNTDWHMPWPKIRPYGHLLTPTIQKSIDEINNKSDINYKLKIKNYWFQQYQHLDWHGWHIHDDSLFSLIYYVNLPNGSSKTSFRCMKKEFEIDIEEGQILVFPSHFEHCSKPNQSKEMKTVISINLGSPDDNYNY